MNGTELLFVSFEAIDAVMKILGAQVNG